jgi:hypothetical protein
MRIALILAAALLPTAAIAQPSRIQPPPAAPRLTLTAEQQAELNRTVALGRQLAVLDRAAQLTTRDMLVRVPDPTGAGIIGWVAEREGNALAVTYYAREGEGYAAVYRGQFLGGRVVSPQVFAAGARPVLTGAAARMAAAREAVQALDHRPCGADSFNILALPPEQDGSAIAVYEISPRLAAERVPAGGHFRTIVAADGAVGESVNLTGECADMTLAPASAGQRPRPPVVNAREATFPNEAHVFLSLWAGRPIVVATGTDAVRLWGVTGEGIGELPQ